MWPRRRLFGLAGRAILMGSLLASFNLVPAVASAQPIPLRVPAAAPVALGAPALLAASAAPGPVSADVLKRLGIQRPAGADLTALSQQVAQQVRAHGLPPSATKGPQAPTGGGLPENLAGGDSQSAMLMTNLDGGSNANFRDILLMADADGREDNVADHATKLVDMTTAALPSGWMLTRSAMSEHTVANGYTETVYYYGDSLGNVYVTADTPSGGSHVLTSTVINLPTTLNAFGNLNSDAQIVITGLGINPVADLTSFPNVNGSFGSFAGKTGEILYVEFWDTGTGLRLLSNGQTIQSGVLAFPIADTPSPAKAAPAVQSNLGFPITVGGAFGVAFSPYANVAGLAVDDDGNVYFQQVDLTNFTGGNIVKLTSVDGAGNSAHPFQDRSLATSGFATLTTLNPPNGQYGSVGGPFSPVTQLTVVTNYAGTSTTWGNIAALAAGPGNVLYAAVARSLVPTDSPALQATEGLFTNTAALGNTPSMVISFADTSGGFAACSVPAGGTTGTLPVPDGFADAAQNGQTLVPGVNNFRAFALGAGPDARPQLAGATAANTPQVDFQVDDTIFSGLAVDEESKVYVISGGTPAGLGLNPSPTRTEILAFPDQQPFDRRADFVDQRGDVLPLPFDVANNVGDGRIDRYDYIYYEAPVDQLTLTPIGLSGLARGFLLYLNRTRGDLTRFTHLPNGQTQGEDTTSGPLNFEDFDAGSSSAPGHQIAGGDDQAAPFRGDDDDGGGLPALASAPLVGGFEFNYRQYVTATATLQPAAWNAFYLNSNGSLTFGSGDTNPTPSVASLLQGAPRLAAAWTHLDPGAHWQHGFLNTFPVQAMGFANINHFVVRWINVPSAGFENCDSSNTFGAGLYDDGTGLDENANQPLNPANPIGNDVVPFNLLEGPTDLHDIQTVDNVQPAGYNARPDHSGNLCYTYGRMDLLGSQAAGDAVLVGAAPGLLPLATTPGVNLSQVAVANDVAFPGLLGVSIGTAAPASPYEFFTAGTANTITVSGGVTTTLAGHPAFDLRQEGNDPALSTPANQPDPNRGQECFYNQSPQTITFAPLANRLLTATPFTATATSTSALPVSFTSLTPTICTVAGVQVLLHLAGQCIIRAGQAGSDAFAPALYIDRAFQVFYPVFIAEVVR